MKMKTPTNFKDEFEDEYYIYIKTIQVYNNELELVDEILVEQVSNNLGEKKSAASDDMQEECIHNTSTIKWKNFIYYFKRIFDNHNHKL